MTELVLVVHLIIAIALIATVLLQRSEGGALGIGGGGGGSGGMFTARGAGNALTKTTALLAVAFFITSISLTVMATRKTAPTSVFEGSGGSENSSSGGVQLPNLGGQKDPSKPQVPTGQ